MFRCEEATDDRGREEATEEMRVEGLYSWCAEAVEIMSIGIISD